MLEKLKNFISKDNNKFYLIILLLLSIIILQFINFNKINKHISRQKQIKYKIIPSETNLFVNLDREIEKMQKVKKRILSEVEKNIFFEGSEEELISENDNNIPNKLNNELITSKNFLYKPETKYLKDKKEFHFILNVPSEIKKNNIKVFFKNNMLRIDIEQQTITKKSNFSNSYKQIFTTPKTKVSFKDIKVNFENNRLLVVIPII